MNSEPWPCGHIKHFPDGQDLGKAIIRELLRLNPDWSSATRQPMLSILFVCQGTICANGLFGSRS